MKPSNFTNAVWRKETWKACWPSLPNSLPPNRSGRKTGVRLATEGERNGGHEYGDDEALGGATVLTEPRADVVHDLLAFLAERMTALNRDKSAAAKQFLTDLKDFHGIDAHALTPKTKLDQFWKLEAAELFGHLKKNVKALAWQNVRLNETDEEKIRGRFQKSKEKLLPLETQIAFIDLLIDQVVYRLYDLTPEEIKLVEGAGR